jgi:tetratricopeptide (TPR) repeat protein
MKKAYLLGLGSGDIEYAVLNASLYIWNCFGYIPLDQLELSIRTLFERMTVLQQTGSLLTLKPVWQMCQNFMGRNHNPKYLLGEALTRADLEDSTCSDNHYELRSSIGSDEMLMAYHFSDFEMAEARLPSAIILYTSVSTMSAANARMYHALILLATAKQNSWSRIRKVKRLLKQMRKWSKSCPQNYLGRQFLVEAELARVQKKVEKAHSKYYLAVIQFRDHGCLLFEALANERAGKFCASIGDKDKANQYLDEALKVYNTWGALGKCEHLKEEMQTSIMCLTCNNN